MRKLKLVAMLSALALTLGMGSALAHSQNGSSEEVQDSEGNTTHTNNVTCGEASEADPANGEAGDVETPLVGVYTDGDAEAASGGIEVCNDGSGTPEELSDVPPVEGRIYAQGSAEDGGTIAADGDQDNQEEIQGWAALDVGTDGTVAVTCGDEEGNLDSTHRTEADSQEDCEPEAPAAP